VDEIPKPDLRRVIDAIQAETRYIADALHEHVGGVPYTVEQMLRGAITRAVERGIELQRDALRERSEEITRRMRKVTKRFPPPEDS
jgi:hypothetical protein